jgi:biopolymer transport protein ExbB
MKRLFSILAITGIMAFGSVQAQEATDSTAATQTKVEEVAAQVDEANAVVTTTDEEPVVEASFTQELKQRFVEGGPGFMGIVLFCLILGLEIAI